MDATMRQKISSLLNFSIILLSEMIVRKKRFAQSTQNEHKIDSKILKVAKLINTEFLTQSKPN